MDKKIVIPKIDLNDLKLSNLQDSFCSAELEKEPICGDLDCEECILYNKNFHHFKEMMKDKFETGLFEDSK